MWWCSGRLKVAPGQTDVTAEFFVSARDLSGAEEFSGVYPLDTIELNVTDPVAVRRRTADSLRPQILALTQIVMGLSHYQLLEYSEAEAMFEEALVSWRDANGQKVVLSLLGNVSGLQGDLDTAESYFSDALSLDPEYARARFGAAEVSYQRSKGPACAGSGEADVAGLEDAVAQFEEVGELPGPPLAFIPERARVEIGKIYQCLFLNGGGHLEEAREILEAVIDDVSDETRLDRPDRGRSFLPGPLPPAQSESGNGNRRVRDGGGHDSKRAPKTRLLPLHGSLYVPARSAGVGRDLLPGGGGDYRTSARPDSNARAS